MPVKKDASGRRSVELQFDLPGTPEQVWQAIATGPGISSWFMKAEVEEHEGGAVVFHHGLGEASSGHVTAWQPPHRFAYEETCWLEGAPPLATELIVEARSGGACTVRLVHSLFASGEEWDDQLESMETGWPGFFDVLRVYLAHFPGWRSALIRVMGQYRGPQAAAWSALVRGLGLADAAKGDRRTVSAEGGPSFAGVIERIVEDPHHRELMLRLDRPSPGIALIGIFTWNDQVLVSACLYFYGDNAPAVAAREERLWQAWMEDTFPRADEAGEGA